MFSQKGILICAISDDDFVHNYMILFLQKLVLAPSAGAKEITMGV